jgi:hypothetical protein
MSPLFGSKGDAKDEAGADLATMTADLERLAALPLDALATEVMIVAFGSDGPGGPGKPGTIEDLTAGSVARVGGIELSRLFSPAYAGRGVGDDLRLQLGSIVAEGLQILENAALVRVVWQGGQPHYMATRRGRAAVSNDALEAALAGGGAHPV